MSVSVPADRALSRLVVTGDLGEIEAVGYDGARGEARCRRARRASAAPCVPSRPRTRSRLSSGVRRAGRAGFEEDPAIRANAVVLDGIPDAPL